MASSELQVMNSCSLVQTSPRILEEIGPKLHYCRRDSIFCPSGRFGSIFKGTFEGTLDVSIRRILKTDFTVELDVLRQTQSHPNILRYYCCEEDVEFIYIASEMFGGTLKHLVKGQYTGPPITDGIKCLSQITHGLDYLHKKQIVHCDLKPSNIYISLPDSSVRPQMKLANFGIHRVCTDRQRVPLWKLAGTKGWLAPEVFLSNKAHFTYEMDLFSLGCTFGFTLSGGIHPFGEEKDDRIVRIRKLEPMTLTVEMLKKSGLNNGAASAVFYLVGSLVNSDPSLRPTTSDLLKHGFFNNKDFALENQKIFSPVVECIEVKADFTRRKLKFEDLNADEVTIVRRSTRKRFHPDQPPRESAIITLEFPDMLYPSSTSLLAIENGPVDSGYREWEVAYNPKIAEVAGESTQQVVQNEQKHLPAFNRESDIPSTSAVTSDDAANRLCNASKSFAPSVIDAIDDENSDSYSDPPSLDPIIPFDTDTFSSINSSKLQPIILDYSLNKHQSNENVPEEAGDSSSSNTPHEGAARVPSGTFLQFSDFTNKTDYANYLRKHLSVGMHVRCCNGYGDIQEGDTGTIIHVERDIIENFNVKVQFQLKSTCWARYHQIEIVNPVIGNVNGSTSRGDSLELTLNEFPPSELDEVVIAGEKRPQCEKDIEIVARTIKSEILEEDNASTSGSLHVQVFDPASNETIFDPVHPEQSYKRARNESDSLKKEEELMDLCYQKKLGKIGIGELENLVEDPDLNINYVDMEMSTPLFAICQKNKSSSLVECVKILLKRDDLDIHRKDRNGQNCLFNLVKNCHDQHFLDVAMLLIEREVFLNDTDDNGDNILMCACSDNKRRGLVDIVRLFLDLGVQVNTLNHNGWNALTILVYNYGGCDLIEIIGILLDAGIGVNARTNHGWNPALALVNRIRQHTHQDFVDIVYLLVEHGANLHCKDSNGQNFLLTLCSSYRGDCFTELLLLLVEQRVNFQVTDDKSRGALISLTANSHLTSELFVQIAGMLIKLGVPVNAVDEDSSNVLHYLCKCHTRENLIRCVRYLITETDVDLEAKDKWGLRPVDYLHKTSNHLIQQYKLDDVIDLLFPLIN